MLRSNKSLFTKLTAKINCILLHRRSECMHELQFAAQRMKVQAQKHFTSVVQLLNQGTNPQSGRIRLRGSFLFLLSAVEGLDDLSRLSGKQKEKKEKSASAQLFKQTIIIKHAMPFNEPQFLKLIFSLADTQQWLDDIIKETLCQLPEIKIKKIMQHDYYLSITALAHILERHYYKIPRHPCAGKFHMEIVEILHCIREAKTTNPIPVSGSNNMQRIYNAAQTIGFDQDGQPASTITIITSQAGNIITAFPGIIKKEQQHCREKNIVVFSSGQGLS